MPNFFTKEQIDKIVALALEAGKMAVNDFEAKNFTIKTKEDGSRVTSTDIAISEFLRHNLEAEFPTIPTICEEGKLREISGDTFFLIDPIDGTSSFIKGNAEFCINIALIKNKKAIFGLIYAPIFEGGKMVFNDERNQIILNDKPIATRQITEEKQLRIITSSRSQTHDVEEYISKNFPNFAENFVIEKIASAVKFFRMIEGDANFYLHFRPSMEWDTAAGQALVEIMGMIPKNLNNGEILTYKKPGFNNPPFLLRSF